MSPAPVACAAGLPVRRGQRGFTLLEILVVMFIIGIIVGFAVLSTDGRAGEDRLQREAERLEALLDYAAEDAILYGFEVGLDLTRDGYRFLRLGEQGWQPVAESDSPLRARELDEVMHLEMVPQENARDTRIPRNNADEEENKEDGLRPEVLFLSSGEITPFELELRSEAAQTRYYLEGELTGKLSMRSEQDEHRQ